VTDRRDTDFRAVLVDARASLTLREFSHACGVEVEVVREMVIEGVIEPIGVRRDDWRFSGEALLRAQCALRLVRDLRVNWPGAALALDLLERLEEHERRRGG
jgi:chaperone modulatory protein CbpM